MKTFIKEILAVVLFFSNITDCQTCKDAMNYYFSSFPIHVLGGNFTYKFEFTSTDLSSVFKISQLTDTTFYLMKETDTILAVFNYNYTYRKLSEKSGPISETFWNPDGTIDSSWSLDIDGTITTFKYMYRNDTILRVQDSKLDEYGYKITLIHDNDSLLIFEFGMEQYCTDVINACKCYFYGTDNLSKEFNFKNGLISEMLLYHRNGELYFSSTLSWRKLYANFVSFFKQSSQKNIFSSNFDILGRHLGKNMKYIQMNFSREISGRHVE